MNPGPTTSSTSPNTATPTPFTGTRGGLRVPPQNLEAEQALLGSIMMRPEVIYELTDRVNEHSFYADRHKSLWRVMLELHTKGSPIDLLSVTTRLRELNGLERAGGATYIGELINAVPSSGNAAHYAHLIHKTHMLRSLISAAEQISDLGFDGSGDLDEILDQAQKKIHEATNNNGSHKFIPIGHTLEDVMSRLDTLSKSTGELRGVPTGFKSIDNKLSGLQQSDLIILAARPSMGKTSLALDIARKSAILHKTPVGIFSLEMSAQQLVDRMLSAEAQVDAWKIRTGKNITEADYGQLSEAMARLDQAPIYIDEQPGNNILRMRAVARRLKAERGLGLIIVDYLQLMVPTQSKANDNVVQQVTEISRSLKNLARELEVPVLALSQLSRAVEQRGGEPRLSDLRDSGSIEQDADVVAFIHREDKYNKDSTRPNVAKIMIEKHRNGPTGTVELYFDDKKTSFMDIEKSDFGDFSSGM